MLLASFLQGIFSKDRTKKETMAASPSITSPPARQHVAYLDGLRALAALFVILAHCAFQMQFEETRLPGGLRPVIHFLWFGHYAVDVFIVLSGFCLALPVVRGDGSLRGGAWTFFGKRARRILPPYFFALGGSLLLIWLAIGHPTGTLWDISLPVTAKGLAAHLLLLQDFFQDTTSKINYSLWSISVEWRIYFLFPLFVLLRRRFGSVPVAAVTVAASYGLLVVGHRTLGTVLDFEGDGLTPQFLGLFALGMLAADASYGTLPALWLRRPSAGSWLLVLATLGMVAASEVPLRHGAALPPAYADLFVGLWAAALLAAAATAPGGWLDRVLSWRPLVFIGTFAYSIYLVHAPLLQVLWQYVFVPLQNRPVPMFLSLSLVGTPLIVGVSYLFFLACERPFLNRRKRETMAETERDAALSPAP